MTTEDADIDRLARRGRSLRIVTWALIGSAILLEALAMAFYPGGFGAPDKFRSIQIHLDLWSYFDALGVKTTVYENKMVGPVPLVQLRAAFGLLRVLMVLLAIGSFVRLQWRAGLALIGAVVFLSMLSFVLTTKEGYRIAEPRELAIHPNAPGNTPLAPLAPLDSRFAPHDSRFDDARAQMEAEAREREARAQQVRAAMRSLDPRLSARELAALHYTSAQVAYLEHDPEETARQLEAISPADFNATYDADWRIRYLQEYAQAGGHPVSPEAYRPTTGIPFPVLRWIAFVLGWFGVAAFLLAFVVEEMARLIRRRLKRLQKLVEALSEGGAASPDATQASTKSSFREAMLNGGLHGA